MYIPGRQLGDDGKSILQTIGLHNTHNYLQTDETLQHALIHWVKWHYSIFMHSLAASWESGLREAQELYGLLRERATQAAATACTTLQREADKLGWSLDLGMPVDGCVIVGGVVLACILFVVVRCCCAYRCCRHAVQMDRAAVLRGRLRGKAETAGDYREGLYGTGRSVSSSECSSEWSSSTKAQRQAERQRLMAANAVRSDEVAREGEGTVAKKRTCASSRLYSRLLPALPRKAPESDHIWIDAPWSFAPSLHKSSLENQNSPYATPRLAAHGDSAARENESAAERRWREILPPFLVRGAEAVVEGAEARVRMPPRSMGINFPLSAVTSPPPALTMESARGRLQSSLPTDAPATPFCSRAGVGVTATLSGAVSASSNSRSAKLMQQQEEMPLPTDAASPADSPERSSACSPSARSPSARSPSARSPSARSPSARSPPSASRGAPCSSGRSRLGRWSPFRHTQAGGEQWRGGEPGAPPEGSVNRSGQKASEGGRGGAGDACGMGSKAACGKGSPGGDGSGGESSPAKRPKSSLGRLDRWSLREHLRFSGQKRVIDFFRDLDGSSDGHLTKKEFAKGVRALGFVNATDEEVRETWAVFDVNGDGKIPYEEIDKKLRERPPSAPEASPATKAQKGLTMMQPSQPIPPPPPPPPPQRRQQRLSPPQPSPQPQQQQRAAPLPHSARGRLQGSAAGSEEQRQRHGRTAYIAPSALRGDEGYVRQTLSMCGVPGKHARQEFARQVESLWAEETARVQAEQQARRKATQTPHWYRCRDPHRTSLPARATASPRRSKSPPPAAAAPFAMFANLFGGGSSSPTQEPPPDLEEGLRKGSKSASGARRSVSPPAATTGNGSTKSGSPPPRAARKATKPQPRSEGQLPAEDAATTANSDTAVVALRDKPVAACASVRASARGSATATKPKKTTEEKSVGESAAASTGKSASVDAGKQSPPQSTRRRMLPGMLSRRSTPKQTKALDTKAGKDGVPRTGAEQRPRKLKDWRREKRAQAEAQAAAAEPIVDRDATDPPGGADATEGQQAKDRAQAAQAAKEATSKAEEPLRLPSATDAGAGTLPDQVRLPPTVSPIIRAELQRRDLDRRIDRVRPMAAAAAVTLQAAQRGMAAKRATRARHLAAKTQKTMEVAKEEEARQSAAERGAAVAIQARRRGSCGRAAAEATREAALQAQRMARTMPSVVRGRAAALLDEGAA